MMSSTPDVIDGMPAHEALGVGLRFSLHPMTDGYVDAILGALGDADTTDLTVTTTDVSTHVAGPEEALARYLRDTVLAADRRSGGAHLAANVLLSRGCPGAVRCDPGALETLPTVDPVARPDTGLRVAVHWALYPLGGAGHMEAIEAAIAAAGDARVAVTPERFVTRLEGDLGAVVGAAVDAWAAAGAVVAHVTSHLFLSATSPTGQ
jgi:energy-coupling factor transport system substrate-specific component